MSLLGLYQRIASVFLLVFFIPSVGIGASMTNLEKSLIRDEGVRFYPYTDSVGKVTIGIGRNLTDRGLSKEEVYILFKHDIEAAMREARKFPWFKSLNGPRQDVVVNMIFNMGIKTFKTFKITIKHIRKGEYEAASKSMLASRWAQQVKGRAKRLSKIMATGGYND